VTYAEARRMPEFGPDGRVPIFLPSWWGYWVGGNAGIHNLPTRPPWFLAALLWPVLRHFPERFPLLKAVPHGAPPVPQIIGAAILLFAIAHLLLFHCYLPNRYTQPTMRVLMILLAGGVLLALVDATLLWAEKSSNEGEPSRGMFTLVVSAILVVVVVGYPLILPMFPTNSYIEGVDHNLYSFIARQPATTHVASLSDEANNLPTFSRRSITIGAECAVPFHPAYYLPLRDRGLQIARAQYSADPAVLKQCVRDLQIDFWLLDRKAFSRKYWHKSRLLRQLRLSAPDEELGIAKAGIPVLQRPPPESVVYKDARFLLLDMRRLLRQL
jgi:hypothetical protein